MQITNNIYVDNIYCIYLEEFKDRKNKAEIYFKDINIQVEMFCGTYIKNSGHLGCKLSHLNVIQDAKEKKYKNIMICEDDARFTSTFPIPVNVPDDWCMFYLGYWDTTNMSVKCEDSATLCTVPPFSLMRLFYSRGTFCYLLNEKMYDSLIANLSAKAYQTGTFAHIDMYYSHFTQNTVPCYGIYPIGSIPKAEMSTIHSSSIDNEQQVLQSILDKAKISYDKIVPQSFYDSLKTKTPFNYLNTTYNNFIKICAIKDMPS